MTQRGRSDKSVVPKINHVMLLPFIFLLERTVAWTHQTWQRTRIESISSYIALAMLETTEILQLNSIPFEYEEERRGDLS